MILLLVPYRRLLAPYPKLAFLDRYIAMALEGWRLLLGSQARFARWLLYEFLRASFEVTFFLSIVWLLGVPMGLAQAILIVFAKECVMVLRLTPGSFGIAEGVQMYFAAIFELDVALVFVAALISRVIEIASLSVISLLLARGLNARIAAAKSDLRESTGKRNLEIRQMKKGET
jgi:uncharacterized membrane protein YbhN (UPF0104 family)